MSDSRSRHQQWILPVAVLSALAAAGCATSAPGEPDDGIPESGAATLSEGFEAGSKTAYAAADVALGTGTWNMDDALIGTSASDVKTGAKAARIRNSGHVTMGFDRTT